MIGWSVLVGMGRRAEVAVWAMMLTLLTIVAFGAVAAPRLLRGAEEASLEQALEDAPLGARQLAVRVISDYPLGDVDDPLERQRARLAEIDDQLAPDLLERFVDERFVADTSRFTVAARAGTEPDAADVPALPTFLTFRVHPELDDHSELVAGRRAAPSDRMVDGASVFEFEVTPETATELGWEIGDLVLLTVDPSDVVTRSFNAGLPPDFVGELVGLRELTDPSESYWFGDARAHRPTVADTGIGANVFAFGLVHPEQMPSRPFVAAGRSPFALEQRRDLDVERVTLDSVDETLAGVLALEASFSTQPTLTRPGVANSLRPVIETEIAQRDAGRSTIVLAAAGVLGVVLATLTQILLAAAGRRRGWLTVARARGASRPQVVGASMVEMAVLATIAVAVGGGLSLVAFSSNASDLEAPIVLATWVGAVLSAGLVAFSEGLRRVTVSGRPSAHPGLGRWGRIAGTVLVAVTAAAVITFRRRGVTAATDGADLLVVLVPVLVPLSVVYLLRFTVPTIVGRAARRGLALGPGRLVGLRRVATDPQSTIGVVAVIVLALTVAALGVGVDRALAEGAVDASWVEVEADYRIDTRQPGVRDAVDALPDTVVGVVGDTRITIERDDEAFGATFNAVDVAAVQSITEGTAADQSLPLELAEPGLDGSIPVVAADRVNGRLVRVGDRFAGVGTRAGQVYEVIEVRGAAYGRTIDFLIADRGVMAAVSGVEPGFDTVLVGGPEAARGEIHAIASAADERLRVRADVLQQQLDDPLSRMVRRGYAVAAAFALLLSLVALAAVAVATARRRQREVAILGVLGAGRRETVAAVVAELVPAAVIGSIVGTFVGWLVARSYSGRYDLSAFAGGTPVSIEAVPIALVLAGAAVALASVVVATVLARRIVVANAADILRIDGAA